MRTVWIIGAAWACASCTALLGVDGDAVLDDPSGATSGSAGDATTTVSTGDATSSTGDTTSTSSSTSTSSAATSSASSGGGTSGSGGAGGSPSGGGGASTTTGAGGSGGVTSSTTTGTGGSGGATASSSGGGGAGGGSTCELPALPVCAGALPTTFTVTSDLTDGWDELAPAATVTAANTLQLRTTNGASESRIQAKSSLEAPSSCAVWIRLVQPSISATAQSGLAIVDGGGAFSIFHLEGELRARDAGGAVQAIAYDAATTSIVRARFDDAGELWLDTSGATDCWTNVDGPYVLSGDPLDVQIFLQRASTTGAATSTFDDYSR